VIVIALKDHKPSPAVSAKYLNDKSTPLQIEVTREKRDFALQVEKP
jgi:hypothetical protein